MKVNWSLVAGRGRVIARETAGRWPYPASRNYLEARRRRRHCDEGRDRGDE